MSLKREINLTDAVLLIVGNVIGAGIFTTSGFLAGELPDPVLFVGIWVLGGILTICGALTYAELAAMYPLAGGDYQYLKAAYGRWAGFLLGWTSFWVIGPGSSAALAIALVSYLAAIFPENGLFPEKPAAVALIAVFSLINIRGIRPGGTTQDIITVGTILILALMIIGGFLFGDGNWLNFTARTGMASGTKLFSTPMIAVIFTYSGWFASAYIGSEIRNPRRNLPLSLIIGTFIVTIIYTLMNVLYLYALPITELKGSVNVAQATVARLFSPAFAWLVSIPIVLAIAASINANILTGARVCYAMADDSAFWSSFRRLHPLYNTPHIAILSQSAIAALLILFGTFNELLGYVVFVMILTSVATGLSLFVLRLRKPALPRPYRTWGYPLVPLLFIGAYSAIAVQIAFSNQSASLLGIGIALSGLPFFFWWRARSEKTPIPDGKLDPGA
jgi:APA family basic amino acid/polyamine antiporter